MSSLKKWLDKILNKGLIIKITKQWPEEKRLDNILDKSKKRRNTPLNKWLNGR